MFSGFTEETSEFLWELSFNNERTWFLEHRTQFENCLKKPLDELARSTFELMEDRYGKYDWRLHISRIYRDARRLFGRGPYKERMWFDLSSLPKDDSDSAPCLYFEIGAAGYRYGIGFHSARSADMAALRALIDSDPADFEKTARKLLKTDKYIIRGEEYKRSKGDRGDILNKFYNRRWLSIECRRDFGGDVLSPELPEILTEGFAQLMPMYDILVRAHLAALREREGSVLE